MTDTEVSLISMASTIAVGVLFLYGVVALSHIKNFRTRRVSERRRRGAPHPSHLRQARRNATNAMSQVVAYASAVAPWLTAVARGGTAAGGRSLGLVGGKTRLSGRHASSVARWLAAVARRGTAAGGRSLGLVRGRIRLAVWQRFARGEVDTADVELVPSEIVPELGSSRRDSIRRFGVSPRASGSHDMSGSCELASAHDEPGSRVATDGRHAHAPRPPLPPNSDRPSTTKTMESDVQALKRKRNALRLSTKPQNSGRDQTDLLKAKQVEGLAQSPEADVEALKAKLRRHDRGHRR
jgi:hypothetical protein